MTIKCNICRYTELEEFIKTHHKYDVPQIVAFDITNGSSDYVKWMETHTTNSGTGVSTCRTSVAESSEDDPSATD